MNPTAAGFTLAPRFRLDEPADAGAGKAGRTRTYSPERDGDIFSFWKSDRAQRLMHEYAAGIEKLVRFLDDVPAHADTLREFGARLRKGPEPGSFYSTEIGLLLGHGKAAFDEILSCMDDPEISVERRREEIGELPRALAVCASGVSSNLEQVARALQTAKPGPQAYMRGELLRSYDAHLQAFAAERHGKEPNYIGDEIHYVNGYRNRLAEDFSLPTTIDHAIPPTVDADGNVAACRAALAVGDRLEQIVNRLADECLDEVGAVVHRDREYVDEDLPAADLTAVLDTWSTRLGPIAARDVLRDVPPSGDGVHEAYRLTEDPSLLQRRIACNLRDADVLAPFRSVTLAGSRRQGYAVKQLGNAIFVKEYSRPKAERARFLRSEDFLLDSVRESGSTPLLRRALAFQNADAVEALLRSGADADARHANGDAAVIAAVRAGAIEPLRPLLEHGADPNVRDGHGEPALLLALRARRIDIVEELLRHKIDARAAGAQGITPLMEAATFPDGTAALKRLVAEGVPLDARDANKRTALHYAAAAGCADNVKALVAAGAEFVSTDRGRATPLLLATQQGHSEVVAALCDSVHEEPANDVRKTGFLRSLFCLGDGPRLAPPKPTALLDLPDDSGMTALMYAAKAGRVDMIRLLLPQVISPLQECERTGFTALRLAAAGGFKTAVDELLPRYLLEDAISEITAAAGIAAAGAHDDVALSLISAMKRREGSDERDAAVKAAYEYILAASAHAGRSAIVESVLEAGADANGSIEGGSPPLVYALMNDHVDVISALLTYGAKQDAETYGGYTPLMQTHSAGACELFLIHGARIDAQDATGRTALSHAAQDFDGAKLRMLLAHRADVRLRDHSQWTPLHYLVTVVRSDCAEERRSLMEELLKAGVDINARTADGDTALHIATRADIADAAQALIDSGADVCLRNNAGHTPLALANVFSGHLSETGRLLLAASARARPA